MMMKRQAKRKIYGLLNLNSPLNIPCYRTCRTEKNYQFTQCLVIVETLNRKSIFGFGRGKGINFAAHTGVGLMLFTHGLNACKTDIAPDENRKRD